MEFRRVLFRSGPYMGQSMNAYFKGAEEQAQDSFREDLQQAKLEGSELTYELGGDCQCKYSDVPICGDDDMCPETQLMYPFICTPSSCRDKLTQGFVKCGVDSLAGRTPWEECKTTKGSAPLWYPLSEIEYEYWVEAGCGYRCCTDAVLAEPACYWIGEKGYVKMKKMCGFEGDVAQYFFKEDVDCRDRKSVV